MSVLPQTSAGGSRGSRNTDAGRVPACPTPAPERSRSRNSCLDRAAEVYAEALLDLTTQTPTETAAAAYVPGGPTVAQLTDQITRRNGMTTRAEG